MYSMPPIRCLHVQAPADRIFRRALSPHCTRETLRADSYERIGKHFGVSSTALGCERASSHKSGRRERVPRMLRN